MVKFLSLLVLGLLGGCATAPVVEEDAEKTVMPAFYTLKEGDKIAHKMPLPNLTKIYVNWTYSDGGKKSKEGFRGWDMDHDGRFDMLEVLDVTGKPYMWAFDFDGDGVIDAVDKKKAPDMATGDASDLLDAL